MVDGPVRLVAAELGDADLDLLVTLQPIPFIHHISGMLLFGRSEEEVATTLETSVR